MRHADPASATPRLLVLGAGSAGGRHARALAAAGAHVAVADPDPERAKSVGLPVHAVNLERPDGYDGIVVASPTVFHLEQAAAALATGATVLVEKPLATSSRGVNDIVRQGRGRLMVGYNLRLHPPLIRLIEMAQEGRAGRIWSVRVWFGSWLPDWRLGVDYRRTYSAQKVLGGGVLLDAIHELDILVWLFGDDGFTVEGAMVDQVGQLEIDTEDTVKALLRHRSGAMIDLSLDYLSRRYRRGVEIFGDRATLRLDWAREVLEIEDASGVTREPADTPIAASYQRQAVRFLAFMRGESAPPVDGERGAASVRLADAVRGGAH